jgi:transposase
LNGKSHEKTVGKNVKNQRFFLTFRWFYAMIYNMKNETKSVMISESEYIELKETITKLNALVTYYENQLLSAKRRQFGTSSERIEGQLSLLSENETSPPPESEIEEITYKRKKQKGKREKDLSGLPVVRFEHELPDSERACSECGETMKDIGVNIRRQIELMPAKVYLKEDAVHSYACDSPDCEETSGKKVMKKANAPKPLISGSLASPSLVAHIAVQKYSNGLPLYRLEKGFQYDGVTISRQTMSNWVIRCTEDYLEPIYERMTWALLKETVLHADETTLQVLREPGRPASSKSYEWLYRTSGCCGTSVVIYDYRETRKQEHPQKFLRDFKGYLHTDGYQVYHNLPPDIIVVGCWAHARRLWENIYKNLTVKRKGSDSEKGLNYINTLFDYERRFKKYPPDKRYKERLEKSKPVAEEFFAWVETLHALPKSPLGEAAYYALSQRKYLENVFLDGRLELSNNRAERSIKPFVMGRKAWLFSNTPSGAKASSIMYSIVETAKENGLRPFQYIQYLLESLPNAISTEIDNFLPWSEEIPGECYIPKKRK